MRAALYIRVSTDEQAKEGYSIEAQKAILERKSAEFNYTVIKHYIDDGYSAKDTRRPALQQLLADAESKTFDVIIFWRLDRLTRNSRDFHKLTERLQMSSVGLKSINDPIDTTSAIGRFQLELSVSLAQLERETISERVYFVMEERARKGLRNGSFAAYGYDLVDGKLVVNQEEAVVVQRIFDMYLNNTGMNSIAHTLNRENILTSFKKTLWSAPSIKYILQNPVYIGKYRWGYQSKTHGKTGNELINDTLHDPIVDISIFDRVQVAIQRRAVGGKKFTNDFLFSSVLHCGRCGRVMTGNGYMKAGKMYRTYKCSGKYDYGTCDFHYISEKAVENAFIKALNVTDAKIEEYFIGPETDKDERDRIESIQRELEAIANRKKRWQLAYANDALTLEELKEHTEEDRSREEFLKKQLEDVPVRTKTYWSKEELISQIKHIRDSWHMINDNKAKKMFIQEGIEYITINTDPTSKVGQGARIKVLVTEMRFRM